MRRVGLVRVLVAVTLMAGCAAGAGEPQPGSGPPDARVLAPVADAAQSPAPSPDAADPEPLPLLAAGLHPDASDALRALGIMASEIAQTIGDAPASAGTHGIDGYVNGEPFSAATDLRIAGRTDAELRTLLEDLGRAGFAAWYRWPGHDGWPASESPHIHAIWVNVPIKASLRAQVHDYCNWRNGLASHTTYTFYRFSQDAVNVVRARFLAHNPTSGRATGS